jgi:hypothetical protein
LLDLEKHIFDGDILSKMVTKSAQTQLQNTVCSVLLARNRSSSGAGYAADEFADAELMIPTEIILSISLLYSARPHHHAETFR